MYKNISQENFKTSLSTFNIDSLNENELEEYLNLSTLYRKLLNEYIKLLGLQKYDELLNKLTNTLPTKLNELTDEYEKIIGMHPSSVIPEEYKLLLDI